MGENTPSHAEMIQWAEEIKGSGYAPEGYLARWADALLVERDARQAAERRADHWERMQANTFARWDAAEARVAALEEAVEKHANCRHYTTIDFVSTCAVCADRDEDCPLRAVLGVQSTPTEPCGDAGCVETRPHAHSYDEAVRDAGTGADDE